MEEAESATYSYLVIYVAISGIRGGAAFAEWVLQMKGMFESTLLMSLLMRMMAIEADQV